MKIEDISRAPDSVVFHAFGVTHSRYLSPGSHVLPLTPCYTTPEEFEAYHPGKQLAVSEIRGGSLIYGSCWSAVEAERYRAQLAAQRADAEADGSAEIARQHAAAANELRRRARELPVVTAETHEPVPGKAYQRLGNMSAQAVARAEAAASGADGVMLVDVGGRYGLRWAPARRKGGQ